jgi:hypothetical protein
MSVGQELLDVPLPDMVTKLAMGIASAQHALDQNSVETAEALAAKTIEIVPAITEEIDADSVKFVNAPKVSMSLLQVGLNPTFYQFSETTIEVTMDIKTKTEEESGGKVTAAASVGFSVWSASVTAEATWNRKFMNEVHGTSKMVVKLVPVPPPPRLVPEVRTADHTKKPS